MADAKRLIALGVPAPLAKELAAQMDSVEGTPGPEGPQGPQGPQGPAGADGSDAEVTFANVSTLSGDWRGLGDEQLIAVLADLETRLQALEPEGD